ncbi:MAG: 6-hydroxymethylpterin diphosphokinase MptE-like protein [Aestuariibacter sp.]
MLKDIRLHIDDDENKQTEIEAELAARIAETKTKNVNAFQRNIPTLLAYLKEGINSNISIFCNKHGDVNIVDYGLGRTFYGLYPEREIKEQVDFTLGHFPYISFYGNKSCEIDVNTESLELKQIPSYSKYQEFSPVADDIELLVVLGCGLGKHILHLLQSTRIRHLLIYEPEIQYFRCSALVIDWEQIFALAKENGTALYIQLEKDGRDLIGDIGELQSNLGNTLKGFYLFQHYNHPVFDEITKKLQFKPWKELEEIGFSIDLNQRPEDYCALWTESIDWGALKPVDKNDGKYLANLEALKKYLPDVYREFEKFVPRKWHPVRMSNGDINIINKERKVSWYGINPNEQCSISVQGFEANPRKDGLVLGYTGNKLKHYLHYQFVEDTESFLQDVHDETGKLPDELKSIIMFGLGIGYQLQQLASEHSMEKVFICEPNSDFFYASLFAIDWEKILSGIDRNKGRIYLNIGDDGSNIFRDLLNQFYSIGPYILANTYFFQTYYNATLNQAIADLREQLRVVITMGEYFDHAFYGISHTQEGVKRNYPILRQNASNSLRAVDKEIPVIFVGNGPSLDNSIETLKSVAKNAIVVSCGTSLEVLYKQGITPDFHAEIEQNRSTYDWAAKIGDKSFLKKISLISCNGIHPDTCTLYKDVYIAFKEGESSTVSTLSVLGEDKYELLKFAFPTVTNFALNLFLKLGFHQLYLMGVDLGFIDNKKHHSVASGYYENGEQLYDYAKSNNTSLVVQGNFRKTVYTKHEFKIAAMIMEESLRSEKVECYNCSNGARISGATPLPLEQVLILERPALKSSVIELVKKNCFEIAADNNNFESKFSKQKLNVELDKITKLLNQNISEIGAAESFPDELRNIIFNSYRKGESLLFYYLYGSMNYFNAVLIQALYSSQGVEKALENFNSIKLRWLEFLTRVKRLMSSTEYIFDTSHSNASRRAIASLAEASESKKIIVVTSSSQFQQAAEKYVSSLPNDVKLKFTTLDKLSVTTVGEHIILCMTSEIFGQFNKETLHSLHENNNVITIAHSIDIALKVANETDLKGIICHSGNLTSNNDESLSCHAYNRFALAFYCVFSRFKFKLILPKFVVHSVSQIADYSKLYEDSEAYFYDCFYFIGMSKERPTAEEAIMADGFRANPVLDLMCQERLVFEYLSTNDFLNRKERIRELNPYLFEH